MSKIYSVNTTVWFFDSYGNLCSGIIQETFHLHQPYYEIHLAHGGTMNVRAENCHLSKDEAIREQSKKTQEKIQKYKDSIQSLDDLFVFCLNHCCAYAEEYTEYEARKACIERAKELGIQIPDSIS